MSNGFNEDISHFNGHIPEFRLCRKELEWREVLLHSLPLIALDHVYLEGLLFLLLKVSEIRPLSHHLLIHPQASLEV